MRISTLVRHLAAVASAATGQPVSVAVYLLVSDLSSVVTNIQITVAAILTGLATLFLCIGGIRYLAAAGSRREMERGKEAMRSAVIGYLLAALSPILVDLLKRIVGL